MRAARERASPGTMQARVVSTAVTIVVVAAVFSVLVVLARGLSGSNDVSTTTTALAAVVVVVVYEPILRRVRPLVTRRLGGVAPCGVADGLLGAIARFEDPDRALRDVATATRSAVDADSVVVWLDVDRALIAAAADPRDAPLDRPSGITDADDLIEGADVVVVPIVDGAAVIGALAVRVGRALRGGTTAAAGQHRCRGGDHRPDGEVAPVGALPARAGAASARRARRAAHGDRGGPSSPNGAASSGSSTTRASSARSSLPASSACWRRPTRPGGRPSRSCSTTSSCCGPRSSVWSVGDPRSR